MACRAKDVLFILAIPLCAVFLRAGAKAQAAPPADGRSPLPMILTRLSGPIVLDGRSDEEAWRSVPPLPMVMQTPSFGGPPSERTEVRIAFDEQYLYAAARLYDREPEKIRNPSKKRDYMEGNAEWFGLIIDTFNDKENALAFFTTPAGLRFDAAVYNDAEAITPLQMPVNLSWNTFWEVAALCDSEGWFAELRIPFSSLRFQVRDGRVVMGLSASRYIARKNEMSIFPAIDPKWGQMSSWKPSQTHEVELQGVLGRNPVYITFYALAGYGQSHDLNEAETAYLRKDSPVREAGLDLKLGLTSNLTVDLTLNTDFAQVEADDQQVNLTRFSLFFPEKRLFFQERAGIFDFGFGGYDQLFYSRRVGLNDDEAVRIYGGARLVGRLGAWDLGFLDMQTAPAGATVDTDALPSENFGVFRVRRRVVNPYSYVGGMITSRLGADGSYNAAYGLDGTFRVSSDDYLLFNWAQTFEDGARNAAASLDPARFRLAWQRRTIRGLGFNLGISRAGQDYNPGMGFEMREDFARADAKALFGWLPGPASFLQSHDVFADGFLVFRNADGTLESGEFGPGWEFAAKSGFMGRFALKAYRESVREAFSFSDDEDVMDVIPGEYTFFGLDGYVMTPQGSLLSALALFDAGTFYDGWRVSLGVKPIWALSPDFTLSGMYQFNRVDFSRRNRAWTAQIIQARVTATLSLKLSASAFVQYNSDIDAVIANVRLRLNPREGNDLYIVYNEDFNTARNRKTPFRPPYASRALMLKYSYTFNF